MPKAGRFVAELVFVFVAASTLFLITIHQMSLDGILPGNDPAVHLGKTKTIIINKGTAYSESPWYPPLFHTFLAVLLLFVGTVDIMVASLILKFVVATINVLMLLSTYLLGRRLLGKGVAISSAVFTILSVPLFEIILWGGYANFLGIAYIALISYIMNRNLGFSVKTFLLFLVTFALVLTHQLATFVFVLVFFPAFLIGTIGSKRRFFTFLTVVLGGGLAMLVWYARIIVPNLSMAISHFFETKEFIYSIPIVNLDAIIKIFGATLFLALAGIPLTFVLLKRRKALSSFSLLLLWVVVPFFFYQSYNFGLYLPYDRFLYFMVTPLAILVGAVVYSLAKLPAFIVPRLSSKIEKKSKTVDIARFFTLAILVTIFSFQGFLFLQRLQSIPQYYETSGIAGYNAGNWLKQYSISDGAVVVSEKPGAWLGVISDHKTIEERKPLPFLGRNLVAEAVLYLFYEMENTLTLTREYVAGDLKSGQVMCVSVYNAWTTALSVPDNGVYVNYVDNHGKSEVVSLSETAKKICWEQRSVNESQLVSKYSHESFTLEKVATVYSESPVINLEWRLTANQDLASIQLKVFSFTEPSLDFREAFVPGVLEWQNPWDKPSVVDKGGDWAVVECPPNNLSDNIVAMLDTENYVSVIFEFADAPEWLSIGALRSHFIDALRVGYEFSNFTKGQNREISFSILLYSFEPKEIERWTQTALKQLLDSKMNLTVQERDFLTYIKEYNIKFVVIDSQRLPLTGELSPILDKVYANDKFVIYAIRR